MLRGPCLYQDLNFNYICVVSFPACWLCVSGSARCCLTLLAASPNLKLTDSEQTVKVKR